jgi:hypothetical protein
LGAHFTHFQPPETTEMNIAVYAYIEQLTKIGEVNILYDRIVNIDFKIPITLPKSKNSRRLAEKEQSDLVRPFRIYCKETAYPYSIIKLSRADLPYRTHKLTHQLQSSVLCETNQSDLYIRLTTRQCLQIHYYNKEFIWQSIDFKKKIYDSIIGYLIPIIMGAAGAVLFLAPWKHPPLNDLKNNHLIPNRKIQPNEKNKEDSVSKNHNGG